MAFLVFLVTSKACLSTQVKYIRSWSESLHWEQPVIFRYHPLYATECSWNYVSATPSCGNCLN